MCFGLRPNHPGHSPFFSPDLPACNPAHRSEWQSAIKVKFVLPASFPSLLFLLPPERRIVDTTEASTPVQSMCVFLLPVIISNPHKG